MDLEAWRRGGQTFRHRGHAVFWRQEGPEDADALLCIHGFPTASWDWHRLWPELIERFRVLAVDMLGYGFSDKPAGHDYTTFEQADLHEALLHQLGVQRVHVLAHDYGDTVAQELLARFQERQAKDHPSLKIDSVCLLNGGLFPETHRIRLVQELLKSPLGFLVGRLMGPRQFGKSLSAVFGPRTQPSPDELRDFWRLVAHNDGPRIAHRLIRYVGERKRNRTRWVGVLQSTTVPDSADRRSRGSRLRQAHGRSLPRDHPPGRRRASRRHRALPARRGSRANAGRVPRVR